MSQYVRPGALQRRHYAYPQHASMGAVPGLDDLLAALTGDVEHGLNSLVTQAKQKSAEIVKAYNDSFDPGVLARKAYDKVTGQRSVDNWAQNIVFYAESVRDTLRRPDVQGKPFYLRQPDTAKRLAEEAKKTLEQFLIELKDFVAGFALFDALGDALAKILTEILNLIIAALSQIADLLLRLGGGVAKAVLAPLTILALGAAGLFVYFKFIRKKKTATSSASTSASTAPKASTP